MFDALGILALGQIPVVHISIPVPPFVSSGGSGGRIWVPEKKVSDREMAILLAAYEEFYA